MPYGQPSSEAEMLALVQGDIAEHQSQALLQSPDEAIRTAEIAARVARAPATGGVAQDILHDATTPEAFAKQWEGTGQNVSEVLEAAGLHPDRIERYGVDTDGKVPKQIFDDAVRQRQRLM